MDEQRPTKADKLISRGSETPGVAQAAAVISEMLLRMQLGQARYFSAAVNNALPGLKADECRDLAYFFSVLAGYYGLRSINSEHAERHFSDHEERQVRSWETGDGTYNIHRVFMVLACDIPTCAHQQGCWETRPAFCRMDAKDK